MQNSDGVYRHKAVQALNLNTLKIKAYIEVDIMAPPVDISYLAVLVAAAAAMAIGFLWYGPLFGNQWKKLMNFTDKGMKEMKMTPVQACKTRPTLR